MGLTALWDTIRKHEESVPVAQLAEEHHRRHGRPLRIAVDEADWRFNNLTVQQVHVIRETSNEYAFQGIEKAMFYRICRLLTLNIQLIFVFDGPSRPWKRGNRGGGRVDFEAQRLLKEMLQYFGIPYHEAPGEAEAECARLQILGLVDAVWSQDSDCIMFGCTLWLRDHRIAKEKGITDRSKENTKKNGKYANVVRACDLKDKCNLDRDGLVLFAMLVGGDYDVKGLPQCGPSLALQAVKQGLGRRLVACRDQTECGSWAVELAMFFERSARGHSIDIPPRFPDFKTLQKYYRPKVTSDEDLLNKSRLNLDHVRPIQELKLLTLTSERFNIWGRLYMNWVGPVLLTRNLVTRDPSLPLELIHDIRLTKQRLKKTDDEPPMRTFERKLTFSPFGVTSLSRADFEGDRVGHWNGEKATFFDPDHRVECEFPQYWLRKILPADVLDPPFRGAQKHTPKRKRPTDDIKEEPAISSTAKRKRGDKGEDVSAAKLPRSASLRKSKEPVSIVRSRNLALTPTARKILDCIELSDSDDEDRPSKPANSHPKELAPSQVQLSNIIDLGSPEPSEQKSDLDVSDTGRGYLANARPLDIPDEEDEGLQLALRLSMQDQGVMIPSTKNPSGFPSSSRGNYDGIFAMREAGRDVSGTSVPAWSLDQTNSNALPPRAAQTQTPRREFENGELHVSQAPIRGIHAGLVGRGPVDIPNWSRPLPPAAVPSKPPMSSSRPGTKDYVQATTAPSPTEIRAARLRHFEMSSPGPLQNTKDQSILPRTTAYNVPVGVECIDLTDD